MAEAKPGLEKVSLKLPVISDLHKEIGMRIDFHVTFTMADNGEALRKKLGLAKSTFSRLRRGTKEITLTEIYYLAEFFDTTVTKIVQAKF